MRRCALIALAVAFCITTPHFSLAQDEPTSARKILAKVQPQYPALAHAGHITGTARLLAKVNASGKVESVEVLGGHPLLAQAASVAVSQWKWEPSSQSTQETVMVKFTLQE